MALRVTFELSDRDLKHFRREMRLARDAAKETTELEIIQAADTLLDEVRKVDAPDFVKERLETLQTLMAMLVDHDWQLPEQERKRVLAALAYFANPYDMIPDDIPGLGFLDDAIMVELIARELRPEIDAYNDFCEYRTTHKKARTQVDPEQMSLRRKQLHSRIRSQRRSRKDRRSRRSGGSLTNFF